VTDFLSIADVADLAGVEVDTIRKHRTRGTMPPPDGYLAASPWWHRRTIDKWLSTRAEPGRPKA
jgi:hypothetical protein